MPVLRSLKHPDTLLSTWFGAGCSPWAPGTVGSAAVLPLAAVIVVGAGPVGLLVAAAILTVVGVWAAGRYIAETGKEDPGEIVIDEAAAQLLPLAVVPFEIMPWIAAFLFFRLFDILKPWPCSYLDRRFHGGFGVMADDIAAGLYAAVCMMGLEFLGAW